MKTLEDEWYVAIKLTVLEIFRDFFVLCNCHIEYPRVLLNT